LIPFFVAFSQDCPVKIPNFDYFYKLLDSVVNFAKNEKCQIKLICK